MKTGSERYWAALWAVEGVGPTLAWRLVRELGSPQAVFEASCDELLGVENLGPRRLAALRQPGLIERSAAVLEDARRRGIGVLFPDHADYPEKLLTTDDAPLVLFYRGKPAAWPRTLGVVGTRMPSLDGIRVTRRFVEEIALAGVVIVSGLARGVDAVAHEAALKAGGVTVAVLGSGLDAVYPSEHRGLLARILRDGCVFSEFLPDEEAMPHGFPLRNRIIAGLSDAVLVTQAPLKSGALITADAALSAARDVFAVPHSALDPRSAGTNRLIQEGAHCALSASDVLLGMGWSPKKAAAVLGGASVTDEEKGLLCLVGQDEPRDLDYLLSRSGGDAASILKALSVLESRRLVNELPGKRWVRA